jgi:hypothetical protein
MNKILTIRSSVRPKSFTLTHNHVRINDRSSRSSQLLYLYHLWSYRRTEVRKFLYHLWPYRRTASTTTCLTVYRETINNYFYLKIFCPNTVIYLAKVRVYTHTLSRKSRYTAILIKEPLNTISYVREALPRNSTAPGQNGIYYINYSCTNHKKPLQPFFT